MTLPIDPIKREAYINKMSESKKGRPAWNKGRTASKESREKMSKSHIGIQAGEKHPLYGKPRTDEVKKKLSDSLKGKTAWNKGKPMAESTKQKMRERVFSEEHKKKLSDAKKGKPSSFKGKHLSESAKQLIREANIGRKQSPETIEKRVSKMRGEDHWNYGCAFSEETRNKISASNKGKHAGEKSYWFGKHPSQESIKKANETRKKTFAEHPEIIQRMSKASSGPNNAHWQGGISFEPYCVKFNAAFKERVRAFFGYCCIECGTPQNGEKLAIHHVHYLKDSCCSEDAPRYFVPLCKQCHAKTNAKREYWEQHFTEIIETYYQGKCYLSEQEIVAIQACV